MSGFKNIARSDEVRERFGTGKRLENHEIALFRDQGKVYALRDRCPHQGAPIHHGHIREGYVVCPHHGWNFRLTDGSFSHNEMVRIKTFPVIEEDGIIRIKLTSDET